MATTKRKPAKGKRKPSRASPPAVEPVVAGGSGPTPARAQANAQGTRPHGFPIIGLGASAGGLEALEQFLSHVPRGCGAAFVVVQHLDPLHKGMLVELLQRVTPLHVVEADDGAAVEPEHIYVIPPGKDMSLLHGQLHLLPQPAIRGRILPIDFFFRSLAQDQAERSIGVILSGMGTDGTLGLRAIKEAAGASFVQSPESAKFDSMPRNAIDAGLADVIAPVEELPAKIFSYRDHAPFIAGERDARINELDSAIDKICALLREHSGNDFTLYKRSTIYRRIERRMSLHQITSPQEYVRFLRENARELDLLFHELLIGVTSFFRDPAEWERLRLEVLPALVTSRIPAGVLRAWVPGCSTGEEAYSLAMLLREAVEPTRAQNNVAVQVFATDLDHDAIETARIGLYPENIAADVSPERLRRFFVREERGYRVSKDIRETVVFAPQNLIVDPPFTKVDIVTCRNLLIYLVSDVQRKLIPLFHYCLNPGGVLFLGSAETVGTFNHMFSPLDGRTRIYRRLDQAVATIPLDMQFATFGRGTLMRGEREEALTSSKRAGASVQAQVDRLLVQRFSPLGVLCNPKGDVLYISSRAGKYFEPAIGQANLNIISMAREGLRYELSSAFTKALRQDRSVTVRGIKVGTNGGTQHVDLTIQRLSEPKELSGTVIVVIADVVASRATAQAQSGLKRLIPRRLAELEDELQRAREETQTVREEMQTSQEELKSTNEELQSTNEELQSTNEELNTSKEELQSLNEELQTVNHELLSKVGELSSSNNDMKNLLNSTDIATLFLDTDLRVRRFTSATAKIIKLIPSDLGRPITDITSDLDYPDLAIDAREVLRSLVFREHHATTRDGRAYSVRIMPYRTIENVIDGVVITFTDATATRALEKAAKEQTFELRQMADSLPHLLWGARADGAVDFLSRQWIEYTGVEEGEQHKWGWLDQVHPVDRDRVRDFWRAAVKRGERFELEFRIRDSAGAYRWFKTRAVPVLDAGGKVTKWYGTSTDVEEMKRAEVRFSNVLQTMSDGFVALDKDLNVITANQALVRLLGHSDGELAGRNLFELLPDGHAIEQRIRDAPGELEIELDGRRLHARTQRDVAEGYWLFVQPSERER
jgi:two-component system CheB/CheR fusion protein